MLAGVDHIVVVNRSPERAEPMVDDLKKLGPIRFAPWRVSYEVSPETHLLVNATSLGAVPERGLDAGRPPESGAVLGGRRRITGLGDADAGRVEDARLPGGDWI